MDERIERRERVGTGRKGQKERENKDERKHRFEKGEGEKMKQSCIEKRTRKSRNAREER